MKLGGYAASAWLAAGFVAAAVVSIALSRSPSGFSCLWFANAFAFAVLARRERPVGPLDLTALFAVAFAVNVVFGSSLAMATLFAAVNIGHITLALFLTRRWVGALPLEISGVREFGLVLGLAGGVAAMAGSLAFAVLAYVLHGWPLVETAWLWLSANALGYAVLLPFMLFVTRPALVALGEPGTALRLAAVCGGSAAVACLSLAWGEFPFALAMLPLMVVAPRLAVIELAIACALTGAAAVAGVMSGILPPFGHGVGALRDGFQVAVAITVSMPFLVGLFVRQMIDDRRRVADAETRWNFALASAGQGVWDMDLRKGGTTYSATWVRMLGYDDGELDGDPDRWLTMIHPDDRAAVETADRAHLAGETQFFEAEFRMRHKDGHWIWILDRGKAIERDGSGRLVRAIGSLTDITQRKQAEERLIVSAAMLADEKERLRVTLQSIGDAVICTDFTDARALQRQLAHAAAHDALTGLANRSSFIDAMEDLVEESRDGGAEHQFMFIDLDHFKLVNDSGGHAAGDDLLKEVANAIRSALGPDDLVARLGGDEFAVVVKSGSAADAQAVAGSIIDAIRALGFNWNGQSHSIGASIGLTPVGANCGEVDEIIARADAACYAAKAAGRGCVFAAASENTEATPGKPPVSMAS